ncbi:BON domain-containing protein [Ralstonia pseudosolanacearum]
MTPHRRHILLALMLSVPAAHAEDDLQNRGHDPFFQISSAIPGCPEPAGPRVSEAEWKRESHHRIEHGNHCWVEGRCRLPNAFAYDEEIADSARRRLQWLSANMPAWRQSTLWVTVWQRWMLVQGCVVPGFAVGSFIDALRAVPDVERVIDETTAHPERGVPYARYRATAPAPGAKAGNGGSGDTKR